MKLKTFFKIQLNDFIDVYDKYFLKTLYVTLIFTIFCFVVIGLLVRFSNFDSTNTKTQASLLSYFFVRYSKNDVYSIVDLSKTVFIFFVSLFSLGLSRINPEKFEKKEVKVFDFFKQIKVNDIFDLGCILILCSILDYGLYQLDYLSYLKASSSELDKYFQSIIHLARIYIPLLLFGFTLYRLTSGHKLKLRFQKVLYLFIALWLFNEFAHDLSQFIRNYVFWTILLPLGEKNYYLFESVIGTVLIAFYYLGYYSAMVTPLKMFEEKLENSKFQ